MTIHVKPDGCHRCGGKVEVSGVFTVGGYIDTTWRCRADHLTQTSDVRLASVLTDEETRTRAVKKARRAG